MDEVTLPGLTEDECSVKAGDLIKFVGDALYYRDTLGVVVKLYSCCNLRGRYDSAIVYMANKDEGRPSKKGPNYHPCALD